MQNATGGFRVYTRLGFFLASIHRGTIKTTADKDASAVLSRREAVRALHTVRGAGLSCWIVPA